ncbi:MAG: DUF58 domain-containing protein [Myxococcota bacterium]
MARPETELLDPGTLSDVEAFGYRARVLADSVVAGVHRSRHHGTSAEFAEHKEYAPGDNLKDLDWRAFARNDRHYVKRFEDESNLRALCVLDTSGSMGYPADAERPSKLRVAALAAAALSYVLNRQGDAVGLATHDDQLVIRVPSRARRGQMQEIMQILAGLEASGPSRLGPVLDSLAEGLRQRSVVLLFSDLLDGGLEALGALSRLRARKHDVALFHVLDPDELEFPFEDATRFLSMEDDRELQIDGRSVRRAYLDEMERFRQQASTSCASARADYRLLRTDAPVGPLLGRFLDERASARASVR